MRLGVTFKLKSRSNKALIPVFRFYMRYWFLFSALIFISPILYAQEAEKPDQGTGAEISKIISSRQHPYLKQGNFSNRAEDLDALYKLSGFRLLWLGNAISTRNTADALELLGKAEEHGLRPESYDVSLLREKLKPILALKPDAYRDLALYDTALSIAMLRYLHDMHYGRINPQGLNFNLQLREKKIINLPTILKDSLQLNTISQLPLLTEPNLQQYQKLKSALETYRSIAEKSIALNFVLKGKLKPGGHHPQLSELSRFLSVLGDLPESAIIASDEKNPVYAPALVQAVKDFQLRHGLSADGIIAMGTVAELNKSIFDRITQIEIAMERLRWLPELNVGRSIIVNIPAFQLWAIDDIGSALPAITNMRVVVGKALKNQTPVLMAQMKYIEFAPYWNVPPKILKDEIMPKLGRKPGFLASQNMEVVGKGGAKGLPLNQDTLEKLRMGVYRVRQRPGTRNSLGKVKFIFPNKDDVYLHDTPADSLFSRNRRDFSHGCVRVEDPLALAEFVLKNQANWNTATIKKAMNSSVNRHVDLQNPIPVLFFYTTAFVDQNNKLTFYPDIYGHDATLLEALKKTDDLSDQSIFLSTSVNLPVPEIVH